MNTEVTVLRSIKYILIIILCLSGEVIFCVTKKEKILVALLMLFINTALRVWDSRVILQLIA